MRGNGHSSPAPTDSDPDTAAQQQVPLLPDLPPSPRSSKADDAPASLPVQTAWSELPNLLLLVFLYALQGVPLGLTFGSIPFLLQSSTSSYTSLGVFSLASWPYSLKLLWSPLVDTFYSARVGRRKSWILPTQTLVGLILVALSFSIDDLIARADIARLAAVFFVLITAVATQDIAVDGWALELLPRHLLSYASTCQSVGQNIGYFLSYSVFLALNNAAFSNSVRTRLWMAASEAPLISLSSYILLWGALFLVSTAYLALFKRETAFVGAAGGSLASLYRRIWSVLCLAPVRSLLVVLLTSRLAFVAADNITVLKMTEKGFPKEHMAAMVFVLFPFELVFPVLVGRWASQGNPLSPWLLGYPFRMGITVLGALLVSAFPAVGSGGIPWWFYGSVLALQLVYSLSVNVLFVSQCAFFSQISDARIGGTYMTLLNTVANLGNTWPKLIVFALTDHWTCKAGLSKDGGGGVEQCATAWPWVREGSDGFYSVSALCFVIGCVWYAVMRRRVLELGTIDKRHWLTG